MLCNILKPVPFHESDKHIFAKIPGGVRTPGPPPPPPPLDPPMGEYTGITLSFRLSVCSFVRQYGYCPGYFFRTTKANGLKIRTLIKQTMENSSA